MITAVVGHRGTGKTQLMSRLQLYLRDQPVEFIDLDTEIEKKIGKTIRELFLEHGEAYFREMERQIFLETLQKPHQEMYLVLGAGFDLAVIPEFVRVLWVKRKTDADGRIFLNRPRLDPELSPLEEFAKRAQVRELRYDQRADEVYLMPEGSFENHHQGMAVEKMILTHTIQDVGGIITILPEYFQSEQRWLLFKQRYSGRGLDYFELRDDLLSGEQIQRVCDEMSADPLLYSFRKTLNGESLVKDPSVQQILSKCAAVDWAWELGQPEDILQLVPREKLILSLHNKEHFADWMRFEHCACHMKYAPEVLSYRELSEGYEWWQSQKTSRSFLPRSASGRWEWYRRMLKGQQKINFWREGSGSASDQPSLWSWLMTSGGPGKFAAVLGDPVYHSFTPMEQSDFFYKRGLSVFAISIHRDEWEEAFPLLQKWGLRYAAVTAPHKENAARLVPQSSLQALNTLFWSESKQQWEGTSTDDQGFYELIDGVGMVAPLQRDIFVWGGGGTLEMIQKALPHASYFSSRTGLPRKGSEAAASVLPKIVIWAAPRSAQTLMPPDDWQPAMVYDLNYKEDSMGREYAQKCGANYQSGFTMFTAQAQGQRMFWKKCEETP